MAITERDGFMGKDTSPADGAEAVTPSDSVSLNFRSRALYVGGAGNLTVLMQSGDTAVFTAVPAGTILPIRVDRVNNTGTTATAIVSLS